MMDMNSGLETEVVAIGLVAMLGMAVWLFFRDEQNGEKSLFSKMLTPYDDGMETRSSVPLLLPSVEERFLKDSRENHEHGFEVLNQRMNMISLASPKETSMQSPRASTIELPDRKNSVQTEPVRQSLEGHWERSEGMMSARKSLGCILVVDDDSAVRKLIKVILEHAGYDVLVAEDGKDAINVVTSGINPTMIDVLITDLSMPKMNGFEVIAYFKREFPSIPLIVLSGMIASGNAASFMPKGISEGISDCLVKPVDAEQLKVSVSRAVAHRQGLEASVRF